MEDEVVRVSVDIKVDELEFVRKMAEINEVSESYIIRSAIADMRFTREQILAGYVMVRAPKDPSDPECPREINFGWKPTK